MLAEHLPECPMLKPCCDVKEFPEHCFCGNFVGGRCLECMAECICEALRACEERVIAAAVQQGSGGYSVIICHHCHEPVAFDTGTWLHLDDTLLCSKEISNETRNIDRLSLQRLPV